MSENEDFIKEQNPEPDDRRRVRHKRHMREVAVSIALLLLLIAVAAVIVFLLTSFIIKRVPHDLFSRRSPAVESTVPASESTSQETKVPVTLEAPETESATEETQVDYLEEVVDGYLSGMTLEDKVAGLFILTPEQLTGASRAQKAGELTKEALSEYKIGGLLYSDENISDREQLTALISDTTAMSEYPLFFCVEEEGGKNSPVSRKLDDITDAGSPGEMGESGEAEQALNAGRSMGSYLNELGFNMDLAPVADLVSGEAGSEVRNRSYGSEPDAVSEMVTSAVNGLQTEGIGSCVKHFPGEGDLLGKDGSSVVEKSLEEIENESVKPFEAAVNCGVSAVMVSDKCYTAYEEGEVPATLSREVVNDLLRQKLGFTGIIISGDLSGKAVLKNMNSGEASVAALKAGVDMLMTPKDFEEAYNAVLEAVHSGDLEEDTIDDILERIYRVKCGFDLSDIQN